MSSFKLFSEPLRAVSRTQISYCFCTHSGLGLGSVSKDMTSHRTCSLFTSVKWHHMTARHKSSSGTKRPGELYHHPRISERL